MRMGWHTPFERGNTPFEPISLDKASKMCYSCHIFRKYDRQKEWEEWLKR